MRRDAARIKKRKPNEDRLINAVLVVVVCAALILLAWSFKNQWQPWLTSHWQTWRDTPTSAIARNTPKLAKAKVPAAALETEEPIKFEFYSTLPETRLHPAIVVNKQTSSLTPSQPISPADIDKELITQKQAHLSLENKL